MSKITVALAGDLPTEVSRDFIEFVERAIGELATLDGQINLKLIDDAEIAILNGKYAGINEPTDVLSFHYEGEGDLGDVAISLETAARQAKAAGNSLHDELATLLTHGILHILGYDHQNKQQQAEMDRLQTKVAEQAGYNYRKMEWKHD